jgi:hypothetical protein
MPVPGLAEESGVTPVDGVRASPGSPELTGRAGKTPGSGEEIGRRVALSAPTPCRGNHPARNRSPSACIPERWPTRSRRWAPWWGGGGRRGARGAGGGGRGPRPRDRSRLPALHGGPCGALRGPDGGTLTDGPGNFTRWSGRGLATIFPPTPCPVVRPATSCHACPQEQGVQVAPDPRSVPSILVLWHPHLRATPQTPKVCRSLGAVGPAEISVAPARARARCSAGWPRRGR